jgi:NAD(P)-dependent dehydrogenase (short-subunit alcohol dehydrogenase family)
VTTTQQLKGRVAIVTGAAQRMGSATAAALHSRGASVILADVDYNLASTRGERDRRERFRPSRLGRCVFTRGCRGGRRYLSGPLRAA